MRGCWTKSPTWLAGTFPVITVLLYRAVVLERDEWLHQVLDRHRDELVGERSWRVLHPD